MTQEQEKDFFIIYHQSDYDWAEWIGWQLEKDKRYTCIIPDWDFRPGSNIVLKKQEALQQAKRVIVVLSPDFLEALFKQTEWTVASVNDNLLPIRVRACKPEGLLAPIEYIDLVNLDANDAYKALIQGIDYERAKPHTEPIYPGPSSQPVPPSPRFPGPAARENVLIASLGDSPVVVSAMYRLLTQREKLGIDRVIVLHPKGEDVLKAYGLVTDALKDVETLEAALLPFDDADSWNNACLFLRDIYKLLDTQQSKDNNVYLSLAGGRKSMSALMAWVAPFFSCVRGLYHVVAPDEDYFPSLEDLVQLSSNECARAMNVAIADLKLVKIPFGTEQRIRMDLIKRLLAATPEELEYIQYENPDKIRFFQTIAKNEDLLDVGITERVREQFSKLLEFNIEAAKAVKRSVEEMYSPEELRYSLRSDCYPYKPAKDHKPEKGRKVNLRAYRTFNSSVQLVYHTQPGDIGDPENKKGVDGVVICELDCEKGGSYRTLQEIATSPGFSIDPVYWLKKPLHIPPVQAESILIVPLGRFPMVATQLYTLLTKEEKRSIREVILLYPEYATEIDNGARLVKAALKKEAGVPCCFEIIRGLEDIDSEAACQSYQRSLEKVIAFYKKERRNYIIDLALSGGRKGMTAMTIFAAQKMGLPFVYHTLVTDEILNDGLEKHATFEDLNRPQFKPKLNDLLFLHRFRFKGKKDIIYEYENEEFYNKFVLFKVPVFAASKQ